jgi:hypothetical protein
MPLFVKLYFRFLNNIPKVVKSAILLHTQFQEQNIKVGLYLVFCFGLSQTVIMFTKAHSLKAEWKMENKVCRNYHSKQTLFLPEYFLFL